VLPLSSAARIGDAAMIAFDMVSTRNDAQAPCKYVQSEAAILAASAEEYATINIWMGNVLTFLLPDRAT